MKQPNTCPHCNELVELLIDAQEQILNMARTRQLESDYDLPLRITEALRKMGYLEPEEMT